MTPDDVRNLIESEYPGVQWKQLAKGWSLWIGGDRLARVSQEAPGASLVLKPAQSALAARDRNYVVTIDRGMAQVRQLLDKEIALLQGRTGRS